MKKITIISLGKETGKSLKIQLESILEKNIIIYYFSIDDKNLDLVLISDNTAKIMDYGKFSFDRKKEKKQKAVKVKEVKFGLNIASHDFSLKVKKIREFLKQNHVLIKVEMRGRELNNIENGFNLFKKILLELDIVGEGTFSEKTISLMVNKK